MLRMGKLTDYATVVLASLAQEPARHRAAAELAERTRLSRPTVSKVLKELQRAGMVISSRGASPRANHGGADSRRIRGADRHYRMQRCLEPVRNRAPVPRRGRVAAGERRHPPRTGRSNAAAAGGTGLLHPAGRRPGLGNSRDTGGGSAVNTGKPSPF